MPKMSRQDGQNLITLSVDRLRSGTPWKEVEEELNAALADGRIDSATADWAHRRTRVVAGQDRAKWRSWAKVVAYIHEDRRAGSWSDRFQERLGRKTRLGGALLELGQAQIDCGYPAEGTETLGRAWPMLVKHGNVGQQGTCRYLQARCEASAERWAQCAVYAKNAAQLLIRADMYTQAGRAQVLAAEAAGELGDDAAAKLAVRDALASARRADDYGRATLFVQLIDYFRAIGDLSEARRLTEPCLAAARASGRVTAMAAAEQSIGILTAVEGDPVGGRSYLIRAAEQFRAAGVGDQALGAKISAAQVAIGAEELAEAKTLLDQVQNDPGTMTSPALHARLLIVQGRLAHAMGDETMAGKRVQEGVAILKAAGFTPAAAGMNVIQPDNTGHG